MRTRAAVVFGSAIFALSIATEPGLVAATGTAGPDIPPALVTFAHPAKRPPAVEVVVDDRAYGEVSRRSYMEIELEPGPHMVSERWVTFRPGKSYCMVWTTDGWILDMVGREVITAEVGRLNRISPDKKAASEAEQERYRRKYEKAVRKAGAPIDSGPPVELTGVTYREELPKKLGGILADQWKAGFGGPHTGMLVVGRETVNFESKADAVEIPVGEIRSFRFRGWLPSSPNPWLEVLYGDDEELRSEFFRSGEYETLFDALVQVTGHG